MVAGGKFVSINQVPGGDGDKYESDPYDHPSVRACVHTRLSAAQQRALLLRSFRESAAPFVRCAEAKRGVAKDLAHFRGGEVKIGAADPPR